MLTPENAMSQGEILCWSKGLIMKQVSSVFIDCPICGHTFRCAENVTLDTSFSQLFVCPRCDLLFSLSAVKPMNSDSASSASYSKLAFTAEVNDSDAIRRILDLSKDSSGDLHEEKLV